MSELVFKKQITNKKEKEVPLHMQAAQLIKPGTFEIVETVIPEPAPEEVLVRVEGSGVCASSMPLFEGRDWFEYPMDPGAPGHESWGTVVAVGKSVSRLKIGQRVTYLGFHGYSEYETAPQSECVVIPESLAGRPFPGEPLSCGFNIMDRSGINPGDQVAIIGAGFLGLMLTNLAANAGADVIVISRRKDALKLAEDFGARHTIRLEDHWKIIDQVKSLTDGRFCNRVVEATGKQWPLDLASDLCGEYGRLIIAGFHQDGLRQVNLQTWNWKALDVINAHERDPQRYIGGMQNAVSAIESGVIDPYPLFTVFHGIDKVEEAFRCQQEKPEGFIKAIIEY